MRAFPFERVPDVTTSTKYNLYLRGDLDAFWPASPPVSAEFKDLFFRMIVKDPAQRLSFDLIHAHPWVKKMEIPTEKEIQEEAERL